ncbi:MAG: ATP-binding protein [Hyphomonadaceae bacterium]|nr:ATP-binding protein [Hyphomonadaceae bacterium]
MLRKHIIQTAIISLIIVAVAVAVDYLVITYLIPDDRPYDATTTIVISLLVAPPFVFFLIHQNARVQIAQASLAEERSQRLVEVEAARDAAEAATRAKSEFLANMSHEIRTPLNGILGMAQALESRQLDEATRDMVGAVRDSGVTLMAILNDVLDLSKIEAGRLEVSATDTNLLHTIQQVHRLFLTTASEKGISFTLSGDATTAHRLHYDPVRVRQCVSNLVSNAVKFTRVGGVDINTSVASAEGGRQRVTITVTDTGIGMDQPTLLRLFEAFTQADGSTTRQFGGTGLGLAISRKLARLMHGDIVARSTPGRGSVFTLTFLADAAQGAATETTARRESTPGRVVRLRDARVLLTDDNAINRQVVRLFLQPHGAVITEATNGQEALDRLANEPFDLVLLDVHMPVMDGAEAIRRIRTSSEPWRDIPVIALTADAMVGDRERLIGMGMTGYVSKPIDQGELLSVIGRVLGSEFVDTAAPAGKAVQDHGAFDDLLADLDKMTGS